MWNLINKINKQSRNRLIDTKNRLTGIRGEGGLGEKSEEIKENTLIDTDNNIVISRWKGGWGQVEETQKLLPFTTAWMELESIMLSEISQVVKDKYHMISPISRT